MSDRKKDERLVELMAEFLDSKDSSTKELSDDGFSQPGLDNKKMLNAIEGHRNEIEILKEEIDGLKRTVQERKQEDSKKTVVSAPEIVALQSSVNKQTTQIGDLIYKQEMMKTDLELESKKQRKSGFGYLGWLLFVSNILLWPLVAYLFWKTNETSNLENNEVVNSINKTTNSSRVNKEVAATLIEADSTKNTDSLNASVEDINYATAENNEEVSESIVEPLEVIVSEKATTAVKQNYTAPAPASSMKYTAPVVAKKEASSQLTQAQIYQQKSKSVSNVREPKKISKVVEPKREVVKKTKPQKKVVKTKKPAVVQEADDFGDFDSEEDDVEFGD
jgi:hypothetical protein